MVCLGGTPSGYPKEFRGKVFDEVHTGFWYCKDEGINERVLLVTRYASRNRKYGKNCESCNLFKEKSCRGSKAYLGIINSDIRVSSCYFGDPFM